MKKTTRPPPSTSSPTSTTGTPPFTQSFAQGRVVRLTSHYVHTKALQIWKILFFTLPLDLYLLIEQSIPIPQFLTTLTYIAIAISVCALFREKAFYLFARAKQSRERLMFATHRRPWLIISIFLGLISIEAIIKLGAIGTAPLLLALIILIPAYRSLKRSTLEKLQRERRLVVDKIYWIEQSNKAIFFFALIPLISSRLVSPMGILSTWGTQNTLHAVLFFGVSLLLLAAAYPHREIFVLPCARCGAPTSRALHALRRCPRCDLEYFQSSP